MNRTTWRRALALPGALVLGATALVAATTTTADAAGSTTYVHLTKDHHVSMPHQIRPGVHVFHVTAATQDSFQLIRPHRGYSISTAVADINQGLQGGDIARLKRFERNTDLLGGVGARPGHPGTLVARIPHGTLWAVDNGPDKAARGQVEVVHAHGAYVQRRITGTATITASGETHWNSAPYSLPRGGMLRFANASDDNHFVEIDKLAAGKTYQDFLDWLKGAEAGAQTPPPLDESHSFFSGVVGPHRVAATNYSLTSGDYVVLCWWPDADMGGEPHAFMGMYREIHVR